MRTSPHLRLGHPLSTLRPSLSNGPGWRIDIWTQGCSIRCTPDCLNPHLLDPDGGYLMPVSSVIDGIMRARESAPEVVAGITLLGGEPTDQLIETTFLLEGSHEAGLSTMAYTGRTLDELRAMRRPAIDRFLRAIDVLVDGPFCQELYDETLAWRGSRNQLVHCLTNRYTPGDLDQAFARQRKAFSVTMHPDGTLCVSGIQCRRGAEEIRAIIDGS